MRLMVGMCEMQDSVEKMMQVLRRRSIGVWETVKQ